MSEIATVMSKVNYWPDKRCDCGLNHRSIYINNNVWNLFDEATLAEFKEAVFQHYREVGKQFAAKGMTPYPHIVMENDEKKLAEIDEFLNYTKRVFSGDREKLIFTVEDNDGRPVTCIGQTMHALGLAWSYFPHWTTVQCNDMRTPQATFEDDTLFRKVIDKRVMYEPVGKPKPKPNGIGTMVTDNGIRKSIKMYTGTQAVSNFRPSAAAAIYEELCPAGGVVWDMSMGWGGRMLGAMACEKVATYIGCDPATDTFAGLEKLRDDILRLISKSVSPDRKIEYQIHCLGSEVAEMRAALPAGGVDLCFTSPPYFDCEKYSDEITQSWVKYQRDDKDATRDAWLYGFMKDTMANCWHALKSGGVMAINIADVKSYKGMVRKLINLAVDEGWEYDETKNLKLTLSSSVGGVKYRNCPTCQKLTADDKGLPSVTKDYDGNWKKCLEHRYKYEPILVFRKPWKP